jgi:hypothetical protein
MSPEMASRMTGLVDQSKRNTSTHAWGLRSQAIDFPGKTKEIVTQATGSDKYSTMKNQPPNHQDQQ